MKLQVIGCSHHNSRVEVRERISFSPAQIRDALAQLRVRFPKSEAVLLSTCNRVELYTAAEDPLGCPSHQDIVDFIAEYHGVTAMEIFDDLFERTGEDAVRHLFTVAASLDSMVIGEAQILSQVKQAYDTATGDDATGPLTHSAFQAAIRVAKRVNTETALSRKRVSIPSVAVADYAKGVFERFDDKKVLVYGAGEMGEETLTYLVAEGARDITIVNRSLERAELLAAKFGGKSAPWEQRLPLLIEADLVISTTGATEPIITLADYHSIEAKRFQRTLLMLDLAVPRDLEPAIGDCVGVYLYSIDDLAAVCNKNRKSREKEWPKAERIIESETARFMADLNHRITAPTIRRLKTQAEEIKNQELARLLNKLAASDPKVHEEVKRAFDRLVNKLLHPPLEALRDEAQQGAPHGLIDAMKRLFGLADDRR
ncbi:glutamyl-tRNA reductase [Lignipirellula cremea]|uniref:Glutamyl-tRNA reductase n=1 Tax=Lignipirellula cremea TaxID=2528010 RepID=A0A518DTZ9_9BACT|nr:glutamyl-tRNA reductase [Lignipirellula cremea]QDU95311.1 Glutamyl-tRNA reductase [Lignipirellula cremea]